MCFMVSLKKEVTTDWIRKRCMFSLKHECDNIDPVLLRRERE